MTALLAANPLWGLNLSGVSEIKSTDEPVIYSASLYPVDLDKTLDDYASLFRENLLDSFKYRKTELITFLSDHKLPSPNRRIQIKYHALP